MVSLVNDSGIHVCGGSLITPDTILTAAHCAKGIHRAQIGRYNLGDDSENWDEFSVRSMTIHDQFSSSLGIRYDFMLLFIHGISNAGLVRLNSEASLPTRGNPLHVIGWGKRNSEFFFRLSNTLQEVKVQYEPNEDCMKSKSLDYGSLYKNRIYEDHLCAGEKMKDACDGDSGGPIVTRDINNNDVQVGIVSWGFECAHNHFPGVYARVSTAFDWIQRETCQHSKQPSWQFFCSPRKQNGKKCGHGDECSSKYCNKGRCKRKRVSKSNI